MMRHRRALWLVLPAMAATALAGSGFRHGASEVRLGFTADAFSSQRAAENRFSRGVSAEFISNAHRELTRRPHPAGSAGTREVVEYLRRELEGFGLEVEVPEYHAYLSAPVEVRLELVSPVREPISLEEPVDPRDPDTSGPDLDPGYIAYSASGDVTAPVVYVNYGLPADYERLRQAGIDVRGRIALARYGRSHRAVKVHTAQERGVAGVILFSDPADDGASRGAVWPEGMWRAEHMLQRGNAKFSWFWHGDPLTPGVGAIRGSTGLDPADAPTLPRIPVVATSATEARKILERLEGSPKAPDEFQGALPFSYHLGPGSVEARLVVRMDDGIKPIYNVVGRIEGATEPDRWVILGTHHDAWTFGAIDPGSSAAVVLEVARGLAELARSGWRPARSLLFAFWDAEEFGLIGSTEFAEDREAELQERAVVYINSDMYTPGRLVAGGSPSLRDFMIEVTRDLPHESGTLYDAWRRTEFARQSPEHRGEEFEVELSALGSGADFVAFQDYVGLPTLSLDILFEGGYGYGTYHSNYDTRFYMEEVSDPGFTWGVRHARLLGVTAMRLANAPVLPYRYSHYVRHIGSFLRDAEGWAGGGDRPAAVKVDTRELQALADTLHARTALLERRIDATLASGRVPGRARELNDVIMRLDQSLLDRSMPVDERWYRHLIYGWNIYALYSGQPLPHLYEAIRLRHGGRIEQEKALIRSALERMLAGVEEAIAIAGEPDLE